MFALVDVNNMYCSVERVFDPRLEGRPVVVLSSNDGACIARSNEAKELGVHMAQPWFQVRHLQKTHGLVALETAETPAQRVLCNEAQPLEVWGVVTTVIRQLLT